MFKLVLASSFALLVATSMPAQVVQGQAPPQAAPPSVTLRPVRPAPAEPRSQAADARSPLTIMVTDAGGMPLPAVDVTVSGPVTRSGATGTDGAVKFQGVRAGSYRLRFEADGFITLERDILVKAVPIPTVDVALDRAPVKKAVEPPPPPPVVVPTVVPPDPNATVDSVSVVQWLAKNRLERGEGRKEAEVLHSALAGAALLQVRESTGERGRPEADEVLYVINGTAALASKGRTQPLETGALLVVPRGVHYTIENKGREPIWILSVLAPPPGK